MASVLPGAKKYLLKSWKTLKSGCLWPPQERKQKQVPGWPTLKKIRLGGATGCKEWAISGDALQRVGLNDRTASTQMPGEGTVYSPIKCRETEGIKDYSSPGTATVRVKLTQGSSNWYSPGSVTYTASSATQYNGTLYRRDWNADDGYYYTAVSGPFYRNYSASRLTFANESDVGVTLYDSTSISATASVSSGSGKTITVLKKSD